jgi:hypothetical protein
MKTRSMMTANTGTTAQGVIHAEQQRDVHEEQREADGHRVAGESEHPVRRQVGGLLERLHRGLQTPEGAVGDEGKVDTEGARREPQEGPGKRQDFGDSPPPLYFESVM